MRTTPSSLVATLQLSPESRRNLLILLLAAPIFLISLYGGYVAGKPLQDEEGSYRSSQEKRAEYAPLLVQQSGIESETPRRSLTKLPDPVLGEPRALPSDPSEAAIDWRYLRMSDEEWERWESLLKESDLRKKTAAARAFLDDFPETPLSPNLHSLLCFEARNRGDLNGFIDHAETVLEEVPELPELRAQLAFVYSERGESEKAEEHAQRSLETLNSLERSGSTDIEKWVRWIFDIRAQANYALGRSYLSEFSRRGGKASQEALEKAATSLRLALHFDPEHEFANLRLALVMRNLGDARSAIEALGRAVALDGVTRKEASSQLAELLEIIEIATVPLNAEVRPQPEIIQEGKEALQEERARILKLQARIVKHLSSGG